MARWNGMDQLAEAYVSYSPYAYIINNPAMYNDVDGRLHQFKMAEENEGLEFSKGLNDMLTTGSKQSTDAWNALNNWGNDKPDYGLLDELIDSWAANGYNSVIKNGRLTWWTDMQSTGIQNQIQGVAGHMIKLQDGFENFVYKTDDFFDNVINTRAGDTLGFTEKHINGGLGIAGMALDGYNKLPNAVKRSYAYKLSKITPWKSGQIFQEAKALSKTLGKTSKVLGIVGTALTVGNLAYEYQSGEWDAHTIVNTGLLVGTVAATIFGAPAVLTGIAIYGIADYAFDISGTIDKNFGRKSNFSYP